MSTRWIVAFGFAFVLALAAPLGSEAEAAKRAKNKMCIAAAMGGSQTKWRCQASEKCCFDWLLNKGTCVGASAVCL